MKIKLQNIATKYAPWILGLGLLLLWEVAARVGWLPEFIIPAPSDVLIALWQDRENLWMNSRVTLIQAFIGLAIGIFLAFFLAIIMDVIPWLNRALYPMLVVTQTIPTVAIAPILVLWLGYDMTPKIVLVILTTLFPIIISILNGFANADKDAIQLLQLMGANRWQILRHVKLPSSMSFFLSGLKVSVSYAFVSSVVAEWLGGFEGLGVYMIQTKRAFSYDKMFAVIVLISLLSLFFMGVVSYIEKYLTPWRFNQKRKSEEKNNMMNHFKKMLVALIISMSVLIPMSASAQASQIEFILDWVPNTNHTGLYVALEKGYFEEAGVEVTIRRPPEGSTTELVGLGQAQFGISFQDSLATRLAGGLPVTAVATIIEHNTSGIIAREDSQITKPVEMEGHTYGTWNDPIELGMLEHIINNEGGDYSQIELVPNQADNSIVGLANSMFESAWVYYAWDGMMAESQGVSTNFFYFRDYAEELDFYSPIIIANNDYLANSPEEATQVVQAIKRGYQYAIENPEEATDILLKHAPELEGQRDFVLASQEWINEAYTSNPEQWGYIDEERWNAFYTWLYESNLTEVDLTQESYFTNEFLGE